MGSPAGYLILRQASDDDDDHGDDDISSKLADIRNVPKSNIMRKFTLMK